MAERKKRRDRDLEEFNRMFLGVLQRKERGKKRVRKAAKRGESWAEDLIEEYGDDEDDY